jgi:tetratricopeptide (TPR) repeat protein
MLPPALFNPFPGLRPFEPDEDHLFFGREKEIDELLRRLGTHRFLTVVGTSGSGKSSLVRSGLIPSLQSGFMVNASSSWRVSILRPGENPIGRLAEALDAPDVLGDPGGRLGETNRIVLDATLRRGTLGLVEAIWHARIPHDENVLIVVDQFEELFRFRQSGHGDKTRDEGTAFVKLLLEAASQSNVAIYVALTLRSDFIGDCMEYPGLPETINDSLYLVPRMTRDELRAAITGPVAVAGGQIAPRLVLRLLNEMGADQDQLPLLQHVLMRTWDHWMAHRTGGPIDIENYEAVGTLREALSQHAEEAYRDAASEESQWITERIFKSLTDTFSDPRGVRRPTSIAELAAICETSETRVEQLVEIFRRPGRSFLMPPAASPLTSATIVDLSHESLMRCWTRLIGWAHQERASAALYVRLSREASWFEEGAAGLWGDPELELGLRWRRENHPTAAWARRYDEAFDRAMQFLERSEKERDRVKAERRAQRIRNLEIAWGSAGVLLVMFVIALVAAVFARTERRRAEANLSLARNAVEETLSATDRDPARLGADVPQMDEFRRDLLGRAKRFYVEFLKEKPDSEELRNEMASAHLRLGHINRMLEQQQEASNEYREAIAEFGSLARANPGKPDYRQALASSYNWLGESLRPVSDQYAGAEKAYASALLLQDQLVAADPANALYKRELARTHYNRGILYGNVAAPGESAFRLAEADFHEAIQLLEPLVQTDRGLEPRQELARAYNNLASLLGQDESRLVETRSYYDQAIRLHEELVKRDSRNREYKLELARFLDNAAEVSRETGSLPSALKANSRALELVDDLSRSAPSLAIEQADAHSLRGRILQSQGSREALEEYRLALALFEGLGRAQDMSQRSDFHQRFGDLLVNIASLRREQPGNETVARTLSEGTGFYLEFARHASASGSRAEAQDVLQNLSRLTPALIDRDRLRLTAPFQDLHEALEKAADHR